MLRGENKKTFEDSCNRRLLEKIMTYGDSCNKRLMERIVTYGDSFNKRLMEDCWQLSADFDNFRKRAEVNLVQAKVC